MVSDFEDALESKDWSSLYNMSYPKEALEVLLNHVEEALNLVAPEKAIKIRPDKPKISLRNRRAIRMLKKEKKADSETKNKEEKSQAEEGEKNDKEKDNVEADTAKNAATEKTPEELVHEMRESKLDY